MAETRPGNPDRGWNDPPMFLYNSDGKAQPSSRKNPLTQRVGVHQSYTSKTTTQAGTGIHPSLLRTNPPTGPSGPPLIPFTPPSTVDSSTSTARSNEVKVQEDKSLELSDGDCDTSIAELRSVLQLCVDKLKARIADDIKRKIDVLESAWKTGKLSEAVQQRMARLSQALSERDYSKAHDVHLSLMVDFVSEVSQWMVGIKRLIMEARSILPRVPTPPPETTGPEPETDGEAIAKGELNQEQSVDELVSPCSLLKVGAKEELNQDQSVDELVPPCSLLKVDDGECKPSDEETVQTEGVEKRIPDEDELDQAKSSVSIPPDLKMSNEKETDESANEIERL
ncbi:steroid receptor RNA activator 1-like [Asterias rubens]|uniref:steroid receptor RNA activator 1-like n=1 Tax=Asterias rubens TaxID=7604 RepID=UPI0014559A01|nr:steroid receptor RNA activator 1-like [Asterias rubens]